jgi:hypothetical protein
MPGMSWWQPTAGSGATFGGRIVLESARLQNSQAERSLVLDLGWRAAQPLSEPYTVWLNLWPKTGGDSVWSRDDRFLPQWSSSSWPVGAGVAQRRNLAIADVPPGEYVLTVSVKATRSGNVLPAETRGAAFTPFGDTGTAVRVVDIRR